MKRVIFLIAVIIQINSCSQNEYTEEGREYILSAELSGHCTDLTAPSLLRK